MVNFRSQLSKNTSEKQINPLEIYDSLDRASDKGPLRPEQTELLQKWSNDFSQHKDVIVKLATGKGKTLLGLLILQSKLNGGQGPALYLCPNKYLVEQTCDQAAQFGIAYCKADEELPEEFLDGETILITTVQKLFNGLSKFGTGTRSLPVRTVLFDDAHSCLDIIRKCFTITLPNTLPVYAELLELFGDALSEQGMGTFAEIKDGSQTAFLPVSYWEWFSKASEVTGLLSKHRAIDEIKFVWPFLKDSVQECICLVAGDRIEISPYQLPIEILGSFSNAQHRVYMSATVNNDSVFVKDLGVSTDAVMNPLQMPNEKWSGERMIIIPGLIDDALTQEVILESFASTASAKGTWPWGVCALVPSFNAAASWKANGSIIAEKDTIFALVKRLKNGDFSKTVVFVNRYDGIDLPDKSCRILIFDGKPFSEELIERYYEDCLSDSEIVKIKTAQRIEQGIGRHIRGEKDYGAVILTGAELVKFVRSKESRKYLSPGTSKQIEIGLTIAKMGKEELILNDAANPKAILMDLLMQLLKRDEGWKEFYAQEMNKLVPSDHIRVLEAYAIDRKAEQCYKKGAIDKAIKTLQGYIDEGKITDAESGWYLQQMARYSLPVNKIQSIALQSKAHKLNPCLLKSQQGLVVRKLDKLGATRVENIRVFLKSFASYSDLSIHISEIVEGLSFGTNSERFEKALEKLGCALGFGSERPDKLWKQGPDNLWQVGEGEYYVIEAKSEVSLDRSEISRNESGQMNNSCGWFTLNYKGCNAIYILVIPPKKLSLGAAFNCNVVLLRAKGLKRLKENVNGFFREFSGVDLSDVEKSHIECAIKAHKLDLESFVEIYTESPRNS